MTSILLALLIPVNSMAMTSQDIIDQYKLENLPYLLDGIMSEQASSHTRTTSTEPIPWWPRSGVNNADWYEYGVHDNVLYHENGEAVLVDEKGPGVVNRIWFTAIDSFDNRTRIKIYIDGEEIPTINTLAKNLFNNSTSPFLYPLSVGQDQSSKSYISYVPVLYNESIKITINENAPKFYYNIGFQSFDPSTEITSFTGQEDISELMTQWQNLGVDPKDASQNEVVNGNISLVGQEQKNLLTLNGSKVINAITLKGNLDNSSVPITDAGRAFKGYSQFQMSIDPSNSGVTLTRRMDAQIADQKAKVYVDNQLVGEWYTPGKSDQPVYRNVDFYIPGGFTKNKSEITVKVEFVDSQIDWNEFYYWAYCDGVLTDQLDIGDTSSESQHQYVINQQNWQGQRTYQDKTDDYPIEDSGIAFKGSSQFKLKVKPNSSSIQLIRRMDYSIGNQKAKVYVDNQYAGEWFTEGQSPSVYYNATFDIPSHLIASKSEVNIRVEYVSSNVDWNEFVYWVKCDGSVTDMLDIGNVDSEGAHDYSVTNQNWIGSRSYTYYKPSGGNELNDTWIKIYWDGEEEPSVNAPLGSFFGVGHFGPATVKALPVGMDEQGKMYMYFAMPFASSARIELESKANNNMVDFDYEIQYKTFTDSFDNVGYFKTNWNETISSYGNELEILRVDGRGKLVGVVQSAKNNEVLNTWNGYFLEGDERIYIDGEKTPSIHGTGTEDFYNGAWYYVDGPFTNALSGAVNLSRSIIPAQAAQYRLLINDAISFNNRIDAYIEHGGGNDSITKEWLLAYYYHKPSEPVYVQTDTIDVGDTASEQAHDYQVSNPVGDVRQVTAHFEGVDYQNIITEDGRGFTGYSQFKVAIESDNTGVMLRRILDYRKTNQKAKVYVDGELVDTWYNAGHNPFTYWREEKFFIPSTFTSGKTELTIKVEYVGTSLSEEWNEFKYEILTRK